MASTLITLTVPASAITPKQCEILKTSFIKAMTYQNNSLDQAKILIGQKVAISISMIEMMKNHPDLKKEDFVDFEKLDDRLNDVALALDPGDLDIHTQAGKLIHDLCASAVSP